MTEQVQETYYRPGLLFLSKFAALQIPVLEPRYYTDPNTGIREQTRPMVMAYFSDESLFGAEGRDEDGFLRADIRGGAFDLDQSAEYYQWDEVEKEAVARKLLRLCADPAQTDFHLYEAPVISPPWPTYDGMKESRIPQVAVEMGLVQEALTYERTTLNRTGVVEALEKKVDASALEVDIEEA